MKFSIMFFSADVDRDNPYHLLFEASKYADQNGFSAVWTPERHFARFGGPFPNPAITSAALAMITERIHLRAGSLVAPIHDVVRVVENWAMVDRLSSGRVGMSIASGWHPNDFTFNPEIYNERREEVVKRIGEIQRLWRGEELTRRNGKGDEVNLKLFPKPVQTELPVWVTSGGAVETFATGGRLGCNLLSHMLTQDIGELRRKIRIYREGLAGAGFDPAGGEVSVMLHAYLGADLAEVKETVRGPFSDYLRSYLDISSVAHPGKPGSRQVPQEVYDEMLNMLFERRFEDAALMGTPESCTKMVDQLAASGVDEIACLLDFGVPDEQVLESLRFLSRLAERYRKVTA